MADTFEYQLCPQRRSVVVALWFIETDDGVADAADRVGELLRVDRFDLPFAACWHPRAGVGRHGELEQFNETGVVAAERDAEDVAAALEPDGDHG